MVEKKYNSYSSKKPNILTTGVTYGANEMVETGLSMGMNNGRTYAIDGMTGDMDDGIMKELLNDGLMSAMSMWSNTIMQKQDDVLKYAYGAGAGTVGLWYNKSKLKGFLKSNKKGRKASLASKFLGDNDNKVEECRLIADFTNMDINSTSSSGNPVAKNVQLDSKNKYETLQVQKEGVNSQLAKLQIDGLRDTFDMKMKTSSFFNTDKPLIRKMTGVTTVSDKYIKKLNALSSSMVFQDSNGNWIGGNEANIALLNSLNLNRV